MRFFFRPSTKLQSSNGMDMLLDVAEGKIPKSRLSAPIVLAAVAAAGTMKLDETATKNIRDSMTSLQNSGMGKNSDAASAILDQGAKEIGKIISDRNHMNIVGRVANDFFGGDLSQCAATNIEAEALRQVAELNKKHGHGQN